MHDHSHTHAPSDSDGKLVAAVAVNVLLTAAQVVGGLISGSLALIADALHNLSDAAALVIALVARRVARRPADASRTFGYQRAEVIGALINLTTLIIVGFYLVYEALARAVSPEPIEGWIVVWVAGLALVVDIVTALLTYRASKGSLNIRAAFVHNVSDALASVAVIVVGTLILLYQWYWADVVATLLISTYVLYQGFTMIRSAIAVLMESVPRDLDIEEVADVMTSVPGVAAVHHIHIWQLDEHHRALEAHVVVDDAGARDAARVKADTRQILDERFAVGHTTLELEHVDETDGCLTTAAERDWTCSS